MRSALTLVVATAPGFAASAAPDCRTYGSDLAAMRVADQSLRALFLADQELPRRQANALQAVDRANTRQMKALLQRCGWPIVSRYGQEASADAWLLVQHADHDRRFQRFALSKLQRAVQAGEARGGDLAYLADRIAVAEGKVQPYGTQFKGIENCRLVLAAIDSRDQVNARRKAIPGMPTLEAYEAAASSALLPTECKAAR